MDKAVETVEKDRIDDSLADAHPRRPALGIFAKEPLPGRVKTRLCPPLSPEQACRLYRVSLEETVSVMRPFTPVIFHAGDSAWFREAFPGVPLQPQGEGDLGERMSRALRHLLASGSAGAALIGSDSPDLRPSMVEKALTALQGTEVVTIPSLDGGYVLVGERRHHPEIFRDMPWSTEAVLERTRRRCAEAKIAYREVGEWEDLDDIDSLKRLLQRSPASETAACARAILGDLPARRAAP